MRHFEDRFEKVLKTRPEDRNRRHGNLSDPDIFPASTYSPPDPGAPRFGGAFFCVHRAPGPCKALLRGPAHSEPAMNTQWLIRRRWWRIGCGLTVVLGLVAPGLAALAPVLAAGEPAGDLQEQLRALAAAEKLTIVGIERVDDTAPRVIDVGGSLEARIGTLLSGYNYMLIHDRNGAVTALRIMGPARDRDPTPAAVAEIRLAATRRGAHLAVDAVMTGPRGGWLRRPLIVDTGATTIVLPESAIPALGFAGTDLVAGTAETAGGPVPARMARLDRVTIGRAVVRDVAVTFVPDAHLGGAALLGMSFLGHFRLTVDDTRNLIVLRPK
ncbi:MAG: hypothetical protein D6826_03875 [Alphaproteobacteria bacterium]|nr:MAG: hypothetical protein D6826_03875 [Alphaproteobacteria bacterium]